MLLRYIFNDWYFNPPQKIVEHSVRPRETLIGESIGMQSRKLHGAIDANRS
ncbi:hypothetical protein WN55_11594 [Dufourea novaeangliae]|uniref:Uncharacterized protein n=1 Tax=Dufourea novaeangliae TaxID=178035 RepID=A0A154PD43_DUFNO|nr:hypothetical protein WN55_11594 [Dufourea novaeangliae]